MLKGVKAKKRKTSSASRKTVSRKSIAVQRKPVVKKDKSKIAWQIALGIAAALWLIFIISKFSTPVTGNVPAVDAAESADEKGVLSELLKPILPYITWIIGESQEDSLLLSRILIAMLWFLAFWFVSGKITEINKKKWFHFGISFILSILFTRWIIVDDILKTVLLPYSAVGAALAAFLPILVAFYFFNFVLDGDNLEPLRLFGWILVLGYLAFGYYNALKDPLVLNKEWLWAYPIAIILTFVLLIFNRKIRAEILLTGLGKTSQGYKDQQKQEILRQIALVEQNLADRMISVDEENRITDNLKKRLREIERMK